MPKLHRIYTQSELLESEVVVFTKLNFDKTVVSEEYTIEKVGKKNIMFVEKTPLGKSVPITSLGFVYPIETNKSGEFMILGTCLKKDQNDMAKDFLEILRDKKSEMEKELNECISATKLSLGLDIWE